MWNDPPVRRDNLCSTWKWRTMHLASQSWTKATRWKLLSGSTRIISRSCTLLTPLVDETILEPQMNCRLRYWKMCPTITVIRLPDRAWVLEMKVQAAYSWPTKNRTAQIRLVVRYGYVLVEIVNWCRVTSSAFTKQWHLVFVVVIDSSEWAERIPHVRVMNVIGTLADLSFSLNVQA